MKTHEIDYDAVVAALEPYAWADLHAGMAPYGGIYANCMLKVPDGMKYDASLAEVRQVLYEQAERAIAAVTGIVGWLSLSKVEIEISGTQEVEARMKLELDQA